LLNSGCETTRFTFKVYELSARQQLNV
jgi:hypothetical protein